MFIIIYCHGVFKQIFFSYRNALTVPYRTVLSVPHRTSRTDSHRTVLHRTHRTLLHVFRIVLTISYRASRKVHIAPFHTVFIDTCRSVPYRVVRTLSYCTLPCRTVLIVPFRTLSHNIVLYHTHPTKSHRAHVSL